MLDSSNNGNSSSNIVVVQNWIEEVKRRLPVWKRELHKDGAAVWTT